MTDIPARRRLLIQDRALGKCERCGGPGHDVHHRQPRQMGGTRRADVHDASNLVLLCRGCHVDVEAHREEAYSVGWLVHSWGDPAAVPVVIHHLGMEVWLETDGAYRLFPGEDGVRLDQHFGLEPQHK